MDPNTPHTGGTGSSGYGTGPGSGSGPSALSRSQRQQDSGESTTSMVDSRELLRQGYPSLKSLPIYSCIVANGTELEWASVQQVLLNIFKHRLTQDFKLSFVDRRQSPWEGPNLQNENLTALVTTKRDLDSDAWYLALKDVELEFSKRDINGLTIEIIDPELYKAFAPPSHFTIHPRDPVVSYWPSLEPRILKLIEHFEWATLSLVRRGTQEEHLANAPTVLIGAPQNTESMWDMIVSSVNGFLSNMNLGGVETIIIPIQDPLSTTGTDDSANKVLSVDEFQENVRIGASFCPAAVNTSATIGGTLRLRKQNTHYKDFLMTIFHPFRTLVGKQAGIHGTRGLSNKFPVEMPSSADRNITLNHYQELIAHTKENLNNAQQKLEWTGDTRQQNRVNVYQAKLKEAVDSVHKITNLNPKVGDLWACSGFVRQLDWSLISAPQRNVQNDVLPATEVNPLTEVYTPLGSRIKMWSMDNVKSETMVLKRGRATGITVGMLNAIKTTVITSHYGDKVTFTAWHVAPRKRLVAFCEPGDSGAWVLDMDSSWIGMVFGAVDGAGLMLPVDRLIADIEDITGAKVELP